MHTPRFNPGHPTHFVPYGSPTRQANHARVMLMSHYRGRNLGDGGGGSSGGGSSGSGSSGSGGGVDATAVMSALTPLVTTGVQVGVDLATAKKQREHEKELAKIQRRIAAKQAEAQAAAAQASSASSAAWVEVGKSWGMWLGLAVVVVGGVYLVTRKKS